MPHQHCLLGDFEACKYRFGGTPPYRSPPFADAAPLDPSLDTRLEPIPGLPSLEELQQKLAGAAALLPGLRKELEAAEAKMDRVVTAVEQERLKGGPSLTEQVRIAGFGHPFCSSLSVGRLW
jgi:hypothetical protein